MKKLINLSFVLIILSSGINGQTGNVQRGFDQITINALKAQVGFLASDWTEGRDTGSEGEYMAGDYIASMLELYGVLPGGDFVTVRDPETRRPVRKQTYFQNFSLMKTSPGENIGISSEVYADGSKKAIVFEEGIDFIITPSYPGGSITAPVVFVGYGYKDEESGYNDFEGLDVKGKIILRLAGIPSDGNERSAIQAYRASRTKDATAYEYGAAGILDVDLNNIDGSGWTANPDFLVKAPAERGRARSRTRLTIPSPELADFAPKASLSVKAANKILSGSGIDITTFKKGMNIKPMKGYKNTISISTSVKSEFIKVRNIVGYIEGENNDEVIVLGAHYDHTGMRDGYIYNGADDNASGTVGVLTIARSILATGAKPKKTLVFALWTGEEKGLLGSRYFVANPTIPKENIKLHTNFDMISRYFSEEEPNKVTISNTPDAPSFKVLSEKYIKEYKIDLAPEYLETYSIPGGSDHASFVGGGIPAARIKPGHREEYHTPADEISTLDWDIMQKIIQLFYLNIWELANTNW